MKNTREIFLEKRPKKGRLFRGEWKSYLVPVESDVTEETLKEKGES